MFIEKMVTTAREWLVTVPHDAPLIDAARLLRSTKTDLVVVCGSSGCLSGVITKTDVVRQISRLPGFKLPVAVSAIMTDDVVSCQPTDQVSTSGRS
ncbi:CBS domain-containing protein [Mesorhizobium sp. M1312]|uniref:CBS domain-containing protein n=1 Tax=unclassified Mesorhizobium TaxID=325217 RepID=UPI003335AA32